MDILDDLIEFDSHYDCDVLDINPHEHSEDRLCQIFTALKHNTSVERVCIGSEVMAYDPASLGVKASLSLAAAISQHPAVKVLSFSYVDHISSFGAIIVAIQQNENLKFLSVVYCRMTNSQMKELEWLVEENGVERLDVDTCRPDNDVFCIARGLRLNQSLKQLKIEGMDSDGRNLWSLSHETLQAIPALIRSNKVMESIDLQYFDVPPDSITQISEAAKVHKSLRTIRLERIGEAGVRALSHLIEADTGVKKLSLGFNRLSGANAVALALPLNGNTCLEELDLGNNQIDSKGATAIAAALHSNVSLKSIDLYENPIGDDGASALAQALTSNKTLTWLTVSHFSERGLNEFAEYLPSMNGLKRLQVHYLTGLTKDGADAFLKGVERNTELEDVALVNTWRDPGTNKLCQEMELKIRYQMLLNRAGKRILKSESHVPDSLWPLVLAKWYCSRNPGALYFFLREKPDVLINKPPPPSRASRKRKRGSWFSGWF